MKVWGFLLFAACSAASATSLYAPSQLPRVQAAAQTAKWLKLLRMEKGFFSGWQSQADGPKFFLHAEGSENPLLELEALAQALHTAPQQEALTDESPECRFPARTRWLRSQALVGATRDPKACPSFSKFAGSLDAAGVSLVFSSYYLNNPSSAFGHTFLRIERKGSYTQPGQPQPSADRVELLDNGINFAADATTANSLVYAYQGMVGGFKGYFAKLPYYYKVREYADFESRDLWTYKLALTQPEVDELVEHLWELGGTWFDYYFFSENCSYHLLGALEALRPDWDWSRRLPGYVIPSETVKLVHAEPGVVSAIEFRPSARRLFETGRERLSSTERSALDDVLSTMHPEGLQERLSLEQTRHVLDVAIDGVDYLRADELLKEKPATLKLKQRFLVARAETPGVSAPTVIPPPMDEAPHLGHAVRRVDLGLITNDDLQPKQASLALRGSFHDLLDPAPGYPTDTSIEALRGEARWDFDRERASLENLDFVRIESLSPVVGADVPIAWAARLGSGRIDEAGHCDDGGRCYAFRAHIDGGLNLALPANLRLYGLLRSEVALGNLEASWARLGLGPRVGLYRAMRGRWSARTEARYLYYPGYEPKGLWSASTEARFKINSTLQLRLNGEWMQDAGAQAQAGLLVFWEI
jgi:hypothetical protein